MFLQTTLLLMVVYRENAFRVTGEFFCCNSMSGFWAKIENKAEWTRCIQVCRILMANTMSS